MNPLQKALEGTKQSIRSYLFEKGEAKEVLRALLQNKWHGLTREELGQIWDEVVVQKVMES